jgi:hypothetical protein
MRKSEILDGADIAATTQTVIDSIILRGVESQNAGELTPLLIRLQFLSRSLKILEPALIAATRALGGQSDRAVGGAHTGHVDDRGETGGASAMPLGTARRHINFAPGC